MTRRLHRRTARAALLSGAASFLALLVAFTATLERQHPQLYDAEHFTRLQLLRETLKKQPNDDLCLVLGTSRLGLALMPERMPRYRTPEGRDVLVFNFSHFGAAPAFQWMQLNRLYREGLRPDWVLIELIPTHLGMRDDNFVAHHVGAADFPVLTRYIQADKLYPQYLRRVCDQAPRYPAHWLGLDTPLSFAVHELGGYGLMTEEASPATRAEKTATTWKLYGEPASRFRQLSPRSVRLLHECFRLCQEQGAKVSLVLMPEGSQLRSWYAPESEGLVQAFLTGVRAKGVEVIDARRWLKDGDFYDEHHVLVRGAEKFTARFGREVLTRLIGESSQTAKAR